MRFKVACADFTFPLIPPDTLLDLLSKFDFDGVGIALFEGRSLAAAACKRFSTTTQLITGGSPR